MERTNEFKVSADHWIVRIATTPVGDALRGRFSGRHLLRSEIAASGLSTILCQSVFRTVRRARLWRSEQLEVARELVGHFTDGLLAGRTDEQLLESFGSTEQAARLIRRAKLRQRPRWWQWWWYLSRTLLIVIALLAMGYGILSARFFLTHSSISHNYWEEINQARRVPDERRAWPLYREAALELTRDDLHLLTEFSDGEVAVGTPVLDELLKRQRPTLEKIHEAANRPALGYLLGDAADRDAAEASSNDSLLHGSFPLSSENESLLMASMDGMHALRALGRLVSLDARTAAAAGDGARFVRDVESLLAMSSQSFQPKVTLIEQLIGLALFNSATSDVSQILEGHAAALSDMELRDLAHLFAGYLHGDIRIHFEGERIGFRDQLQRIYSDNGHGGGRVSPEGYQFLLSLASTFRNGMLTENAVAPGVTALMADRAEEERFYTEFLDKAIAAHDGPPWQWNADEVRAANQLLELNGKWPAERLRHVLTFLLAPSVSGAIAASETAVLHRDAVMTAIALVLWHRREGAWPQRLEQLTPDLLPSVPLDRYDGQPLRYVLRDNKPVLYSVGADRDDDGGYASDPPADVMWGFAPPRSSHAIPTSSGDWILWPRGRADTNGG